MLFIARGDVLLELSADSDFNGGSASAYYAYVTGNNVTGYITSMSMFYNPGRAGLTVLSGNVMAQVRAGGRGCVDEHRRQDGHVRVRC